MFFPSSEKKGVPSREEVSNLPEGRHAKGKKANLPKAKEKKKKKKV